MKFVCKVCGYVYQGDAAPEQCPVCKAPSSMFEEVKGEIKLAAEHVYGVYGKTVKNNENVSEEDKKYILCKENIVPGVEVWGDNKDIVSVNVLVRLFDIIFPQKYVNSEEKYMELLNNYSDTDEYCL